MPAAASETQSLGLKIIQLEASAFKRLRAVRIKPDGNVVQITGRNGQGKSSVLDAIAAALGGGHNTPDRPVRRGNKKAEIRLDLGNGTTTELVVERTFTEKGGSLTITAPDGSEIRSPQAVLDKLYGSLAFDPLAFTRMAPRDQVNAIKTITGLHETFARLDEVKAAATRAKTEAGRTVKTLELQITAIPNVEGPDAEVSMADLADKMDHATKQNAQNDKARSWVAEKKRRLEQAEVEITNLREQLELSEKTKADLVKQIAEWEPKVAEMQDEDVGAIKTEMQGIEARNAIARRRRERKALVAKLDEARKFERDAARAAEDAEANRELALAEAKLPVKGLGFSEEGVTLNGLPFEQASSAEQIRASVAMGLAQNPKLRVMLVREGSLLDADSMRLLQEVADEYDAQVIVERVTNGERIGVVIEDGEVLEGGAA